MLITVSDIIKTSWQTYTRNWRRWIIFIALMLVPSIVFGAYVATALFFRPNLPFTPTIVSGIIVFLAVAVFAIWTSSALTVQLRSFLLSSPTSWRGAYGTAGRILWPVIYTSVFAGLIILAGGILFIIPGLIFAIWFLFNTYEVLFDGQRGWSALTASRRLVVGRWWEILWRALAPGALFAIVIYVGLRILIWLLSLFLPDTAVVIINVVLSTLCNLFIVPLTLLPTLALYESAKQNPHA